MRIDKKPFRAADAILMADMHLRDTQPKCRRDDYWEAQETKITFIHELQVKHNCPILIAGDVFHEAKPSHYLLQWAIGFLPKGIVCIPGQHDLPQHNPELFLHSGLGVLYSAGNVRVLHKGWPGHETFDLVIWGFGWGSELKPVDPLFKEHKKEIALVHRLINRPTGDRTFPSADSPYEIMDRLEGFDLIVSGDNHLPFVVKRGKQLLVNPGSMMRMTADQIDHRPRVYLWYADTNEVEPAYLPIEGGVIDRSHIEEPEARDARLEAYEARLREGVEVGVSFDDNMKEYIRKNKVEKPVADKVYEAMEDKKK